MPRPVLFVQGGGEGAYEEDAKLAASLRSELGPDFEVRYPKMPDEDEPDYSAWSALIDQELAAMGEGAMAVGHSIGASVLIRRLAEGGPVQTLAGVFLIAAPFWHDHKVWRWKEVELPKDAGARLAGGPPLFLYHGGEDEVVPVDHLRLYAKAFPQAAMRVLDGRNHQLNDDLSEVASDLLRLAEGRGGRRTP
jgi:uncharacterized protein